MSGTDDEDERPHDVFRDGEVHVLSEMCATCVFRAGNLMRLQAGRLREMVQESLAEDSAITCHATLYGGAEHNAVCRGFYDRYKHHVFPLRLAILCERISYDDPPTRPPTKETE